MTAYKAIEKGHIPAAQFVEILKGFYELHQGVQLRLARLEEKVETLGQSRTVRVHQNKALKRLEPVLSVYPTVSA